MARGAGANVELGVPSSESDDEPVVSGDEEAEEVVDEEVRPSIFSAEEQGEVQVIGLKESLAFAMRSGRDLQDAREDLYLDALDLTLERHLWTPQFVANATVDVAYSDAGGLNDL